LENRDDEDGNTLEREQDLCEPITKSSENEVEEVVELDNFSLEESSTDKLYMWKQEMSEKVSNDGYGHMLGNIATYGRRQSFLTFSLQQYL
jgi:hypothetical protein